MEDPATPYGENTTAPHVVTSQEREQEVDEKCDLMTTNGSYEAELILSADILTDPRIRDQLFHFVTSI